MAETTGGKLIPDTVHTHMDKTLYFEYAFPYMSRIAAIIIIILLCGCFEKQSLAQTGLPTEVSVDFKSFYGLHDKMPFYFWANRMGQIPQAAGTLFTTQASATGRWYAAEQRYGFESGFRVFHSTGDLDITRFVEAYGRFSSKYLIAGAGLYADSLQLDGLSVSNGNFISGQNATPFFKLQIGTNGFIPVGKRNFSIAGLWEEGYMGPGNLVKNTLLHHKNLFFRWGTVEKLQFTWGIDHYAQWSGKSPTQGELPSKPMDYIRTVFSLPGGPNANTSDQANVQGNQLGQYYFIFRKAYEKTTLEARMVHPFEDFSGMVFVNFPDNLYGISVYFHESKLLDRIVFEGYYTKHQSGTDIDKKTGKYRHRNGRDNYFNHSTYGSFTHSGFMIGSPLFYPLNFNTDGVVTHIANNRIWAVHGGMTGKWINRRLEWKLMATWSNNSGTYGKYFTEKRLQLYTTAETRYYFSRFPAWIGTSVAYDRGNLRSGIHRNVAGVMVTAGVKM